MKNEKIVLEVSLVVNSMNQLVLKVWGRDQPISFESNFMPDIAESIELEENLTNAYRVFKTLYGVENCNKFMSAFYHYGLKKTYDDRKRYSEPLQIREVVDIVIGLKALLSDIILPKDMRYYGHDIQRIFEHSMISFFSFELPLDDLLLHLIRRGGDIFREHQRQILDHAVGQIFYLE